MGRSGTSALTRVLSLCGATLPAGMMGADETNQRGYWEPRESLLLNRSILERRGSAWWDPSLRVLEEGAFTPAERAACTADVAAYLRSLPDAPLLVIKDLQIVVLAEMWFEAAREAGLDVAVVIAVRRPQEVIASLGKATGASPELASALWLKGNLLAERHSRGVPRVFVEYTQLLENWRREVKRISAALEIDLRADEESAVDEFLTPDLRRNRDSGPVINRFGTDWMSAVYEAMHAAALDGSPDIATLDRVFEAYRASEHDFRLALEDARSHSNRFTARLLRPSLMRPALEVVAMAHRRRGTWA
ncbi:sulfotransferase family protein [Mycobacterium paraseoulense]|uniref:Sulfotransferase family protein n=2 Tax=Mycobacterium paraseoulense TaxID=590652 RepID=A0A1X0I7Q8_9MYCO|nr:sulfotransferase family protein [Mycobacterium paraseoulense]ORB37210.1 sulfotransferase family protein [Mycobacterium paraseoulense]